MRRFLFVLLLTVVLGVTQHATVLAQSAPDTAVKAVLFYSPTCPHCHTVINDTLLPLMDQYGDRLVVIGIDITQPGGQTLYNASTAQFQISDERLGVPRLIVGETVLIGSLEIPQQLPSIIETGLSNGGIDWPDIPGLVEAMAAGQ
ncbi:MAG: vitamin K epoxide reductase, partial [Anaerolineae bacterium]|nr:vitamin K epoxide reductase [Anaerolineae bacterium]